MTRPYKTVIVFYLPDYASLEIIQQGDIILDLFWLLTVPFFLASVAGKIRKQANFTLLFWCTVPKLIFPGSFPLLCNGAPISRSARRLS